MPFDCSDLVPLDSNDRVPFDSIDPVPTYTDLQDFRRFARAAKASGMSDITCQRLKMCSDVLLLLMDIINSVCVLFIF